MEIEEDIEQVAGQIDQVGIIEKRGYISRADREARNWQASRHLLYLITKGSEFSTNLRFFLSDLANILLLLKRDPIFIPLGVGSKHLEAINHKFGYRAIYDFFSERLELRFFLVKTSGNDVIFQGREGKEFLEVSKGILHMYREIPIREDQIIPFDVSLLFKENRVGRFVIMTNSRLVFIIEQRQIEANDPESLTLSIAAYLSKVDAISLAKLRWYLDE